MSFNITFQTPPVFGVEFAEPGSFVAEFSPHIEVPVTDYYDGEYEVTPSAQTQTIPIIGKTARHNITVKPIPSNYGLITFNGSVLTVM